MAGAYVPGGQTPEQMAAAQKQKREQDAATAADQARQEAARNASLGSRGVNFVQGPGGTTYSGTNPPQSVGDIQRQRQAEAQAKADADSKERVKQAQIKALLKQFTPTGGGISPPGPGNLPPQTAGESDAAAQAFARAKDKIGQASRGAVDSLRDVYASSGNLGSYNRSASGVMSSGLGQIADVASQQASAEERRLAEIADRNYAGDLTRRGQDMSYLQSILGGLINLY